MQPDPMNAACEEFRQHLQAGGELTGAEALHSESCESCGDLAADALLTALLEEKPQMAAPPEFARKLALGLPQRRPLWRERHRHLGLSAAVALLLVLLVAFTVADPRWLSFRGPISLVVASVLLAEVAGIAVWLGTSSTRQRRG